MNTSTRNTLVWLACALGPLAFVIGFFLLLITMSGCSNGPAGRIHAGSSIVSQDGPAKVPGHAETVTTTATTPLPAGTVIEVSQAPASPAVTTSQKVTGLPAKAAPPVRLTIPSPSVLTVTTRTETATGPQAFTPPAPPTPSDQATGRAVWIYRLAVLLGGVAAVFGFTQGWPMVGGGGACVLAGGIAALFLAAHPYVSLLLGCGVILAIAGPLIWQFWLKNEATIKADADALVQDVKAAAVKVEKSVAPVVVK